MKKLLCTLLTLAIVLTALPAGAFAKSETVTLYGNKISVHAKQVCFVKGHNNDISDLPMIVMAEYYEPSAPKYYYVGDAAVDFKLVAEKLPELQSVAVVYSDVKNTAALTDMKDLARLGLYCNNGAEGLGFLKNLTGLKSFRYVNTDCKSINPVSYLKNLTELHLDGCEITDMKPLKGLTKLTDLHLEYYFLEDLSGLSRMKNLRRLYVNGYKLADVSALKKLTKLRQLSLDDTDMVSAKELSALSQITSLELINCSVSDFDAFADMKNLKEFYLMPHRANNKIISTVTQMTQLEAFEMIVTGTEGIKDCSFLKNHKKLKRLTLSMNNITDISPLKGLTNLEYLALGDNPVKDISVVKNFKKLAYLDIHGTEVTDLSPLSGLTELAELNIASTSPKSFAPLLKLKKLQHVNIYNTDISEEDVAKIKKNNPDCEIFNGYFPEDRG